MGDGSISTVTAVATAAGRIVADAGGGFDVIGTNTYAEEGSATVVVVITDAKGPRLTVQGTAAVADSPLSLTLQAPAPVEGIALSGVTLATFTDADPAATAADFTATITWGDGSTATLTAVATAAGRIVADGAGFAIIGSHTYAEEAAGLAFQVRVVDGGGASDAKSASIAVADAAPLSATGLTIVATQGTAFSGIVATFTDADPDGSLGDYTAVITWEDGSTSPGTISVDAGGGFDVNGTHTYSAADPRISVLITDVGGAKHTATVGVSETAANHLVVTTEPPAGVVAGDNFTLKVSYEDAYDNVVTSFGGMVTLSLASGPGGTLRGTLTRAAAGGIHHLSGLRLNGAGRYVIQAAGPAGVASATSGAIAVTPAAAAKLVVTTTTTSVIAAGNPFGFAVTAEDIYDNPVTSYGGTVTVALSDGVLGGTLTATAAGGVATFSGLSLTKTGTTSLWPVPPA